MTAAKRPSFDPQGPAQRRFERAVRALDFDPLDPWVGGYADYEWDHLRPVMAAYGVEAGGRDVLEFGCNVGGSAVVLAALGARLCAVDIDRAILPVTRANLSRHGLEARIVGIDEGAVLPFGAASFDLILANSVFEYIDSRRLDSILGELHRVLRPGGSLFVCGTASRLALRERHSGRWLVNILPRGIDRLIGRPLQRGLAPWRLMRAVRGRFEVTGGGAWLAARRAVHGHISLPMRGYALLGRAIGRSPGWFAPHVELLLRKP